MSAAGTGALAWLARVPFVVVLLASLYFLLAPSDDLPGGPEVWDKLEHASLFAALGLTGRLARLPAVVLLVGLAGYACLSEVLQGTVAGRDGDWHDAVADGVGLVVRLVVFALGRRLIRPAAAPAGRCPGRRPG